MPTSDRKQPQGIKQSDTLPGYGGEKDAAAVYNPDVDVSGIYEARLIRKMDWRLPPWLSFLFLLSFLDRTSIGNAKVHRQISLFRTSFDVYFR